MKTKIQVFSDIHMEAYTDKQILWKFVKPRAPIAVVAGDIDSHDFEKTVSMIAERFEHVIVLFGNHEWYRKDISWRPDITKMPDNVHILDRDVFEYRDIVFIGATLWTDFKNQDWFVMNAAKDNINDFHVIRNGAHKFTPQFAYDLHVKDKQYIKMMIEKYHQNTIKKIVVVTHFMPSYEVVDMKWKMNPDTDTLNWYFSAQCNDLLFMEGVKVWIHGHSHDAMDKKIAGVRIVRNPLGYPGENVKFKDKVITI